MASSGLSREELVSLENEISRLENMKLELTRSLKEVNHELDIAYLRYSSSETPQQPSEPSSLATKSPPEPPPPAPTVTNFECPEWIRYTDESGYYYFLHEESGESRWNLPPEAKGLYIDGDDYEPEEPGQYYVEHTEQAGDAKPHAKVDESQEQVTALLSEQTKLLHLVGEQNKELVRQLALAKQETLDAEDRSRSLADPPVVVGVPVSEPLGMSNTPVTIPLSRTSSPAESEQSLLLRLSSYSDNSPRLSSPASPQALSRAFSHASGDEKSPHCHTNLLSKSYSDGAATAPLSVKLKSSPEVFVTGTPVAEKAKAVSLVNGYLHYNAGLFTFLGARHRLFFELQGDCLAYAKNEQNMRKEVKVKRFYINEMVSVIRPNLTNFIIALSTRKKLLKLRGPDASTVTTWVNQLSAMVELQNEVVGNYRVEEYSELMFESEDDSSSSFSSDEN